MSDHLATALRDMRSIARLAREARGSLKARDLGSTDFALSDLERRAEMSADTLGETRDRELGRWPERPDQTLKYRVHPERWAPKRAEQVEPGLHEVSDGERITPENVDLGLTE